MMNIDTSIHTIKAGMVTAVEKARTSWETVDIDSLARSEWVRKGQELWRTFGFEHRPVQAIGAVVFAGFLYVAIGGVSAQPEPEPREVVAARIAPIGTVNLAPVQNPQIADSADATQTSAASVN